MTDSFIKYVVGAAIFGLPGYGIGATIMPASFEATIGVGETVSVNKTITTDPNGASAVDVFFLADNTGSMGGIINTAAARASDILNASAFSSTDIAFGVGSYFGDPSEGLAGAAAYNVLQPITTDKTAVTAGIGAWTSTGGGDTPEANLYALQQTASEGAAGSGEVSAGDASGWRPGSQRIAAWFGDAAGHQDTVDLNESITSLTDAGVTVVAFNSGGGGAGIDGSYSDGTSDARNQASAIIDATGGSLVNNFAALDSDSFVDAVVNAISEASSTLDLLFDTSGDTSGLEIAFTCTDLLGCDDVAGGESRGFRLDITGVVPGIYDFSVFARGVAAFENDLITVAGGGDGDGSGNGGVEVATPPVTILAGLFVLAAGMVRNRGRSAL